MSDSYQRSPLTRIEFFRDLLGLRNEADVAELSRRWRHSQRVRTLDLMQADYQARKASLPSSPGARS
jgi:hypothetical protein